MDRSPAAGRFLMCPPQHFAVVYAINPWMEPERWSQDHVMLRTASHNEWQRLYRTLIDLGGEVELLPPAPELPDLVFTANAAVVLDGTVLLSRFRHPQRRREEPHFEAAFRALLAKGRIDRIRKLPAGIVLEGAGDCVFDAGRNLFWMGYGPRSDLAARRIVEETFGVEVVALELSDPRFYHMDTALCPLPGGEVMVLPDAFTAAGRAAIQDRVAATERIEIDMTDGLLLAANTVSVGNSLMMSACSSALRGKLAERGYRLVTIELQSFLRSGGSAFCLTLRLDRSSVGHTRRLPRAAG